MGSRRGKKVSYYLDEQTAAKLAELAEAQRRSKTAVVEAAIAEEWKRQQKRAAREAGR